MTHFLKNISAELFNEKYPVGSRFKYFSVVGIPDGIEVITRSPAWALGSGHVVVSLIGKAGGFHITHLQYLGEPLKPLPRLTLMDVARVKGMCVQAMSIYPKPDSQGYFKSVRLTPTQVGVFGTGQEAIILENWLKEITPELVMRLATEIEEGMGNVSFIREKR